MDAVQKDVTQILERLRHGDEDAAERLVAVVYDELRRMAQARLRSERADHTLQATALVHEAFVRLFGSESGWVNRAHFFGAASEAMRRILVDHARRRRALKRGGGQAPVVLDEEAAAVAPGEDVVAVSAALDRLAELDPQKAELVKLRFFAGLTIEEVAAALDRSVRSVNRDWQFAKAWLYRELHGQP